MDKRHAPPRAVSLVLRLLTFMIRYDADPRSRPEAGDRRMSRRTNGLSSAEYPEEAHSDGGLRHTRLRSAIPRDRPAELARSGPASTGGGPGPGPDAAKPPPCGVPIAEARLPAAVSPLGEVMRQTRDDDTGYRAMRRPIGRSKVRQ
jgi:hypothetical protein